MKSKMVVVVVWVVPCSKWRAAIAKAPPEECPRLSSCKTICPQNHVSGKKKAYIHKLFGSVALGTTLRLPQGQTQSWWTFRIFLFFSARGGGRGSPRPRGGGGGLVFVENPIKGLWAPSPGGGGAEGPGGCLRRIGDFLGGGGGKYFFSGPKCPPSSFFREKQKGVENSGEGKTYHKTPSQKRFWTPPPMVRFPPPVCFLPVVFLRGNRHRPGKSHFLRPPKLVLEGALYGTFPPQTRAIRFPPPLAASQVFGCMPKEKNF